MDNSITKYKDACKQERVNSLQDYRPLPEEQVPSVDHRRLDRGMLRRPLRDGGHIEGGVGAHRSGRPPNHALRQVGLQRTN